MRIGSLSSPMSGSAKSWRSSLWRVLKLPPEMASLDRLKSGSFDQNRFKQLEAITSTFVRGYNLMFDRGAVVNLTTAFRDTPAERRGFLVEGAAMGACIRDGLSLRRSHLDSLYREYGGEFQYLIQVGTGWALARMPWLGGHIKRRLPLFHFSLTLDGQGFHDTFFHPERLTDGDLRETRGKALKAYDQGIGRALWFVSLCRVDQVSDIVSGFSGDRHNDLLSGLGLALTYTGVASPADCSRLLDRFPEHRGAIAQGAAFAATAHVEAATGNEDSERVCAALAGLPAQACAEIVTRQRPAASPATKANGLHLYEAWRRSVQQTLISQPQHELLRAPS
ncbi:hypothetical protein FIV00_17085 [Labrenzia sp. THAF82]|uniref:DUF1702 family protein n=1 Tax=Labrenzia sp. THAF82 TaxID=2587861 RepID=UPI0012692BF8|nr:DUF1702 family protein [Labrenzia sp. THAF82]QFT32208.1 hypothetical protein FIV00_17085 [Labrenzia sp. THAF82]